MCIRDRSEYAPFTRRVLEQLPDLKIIANSAMGVDNIALDAAKELGIAVTNVPDYCFDEVAEHAMALILSTLRNIPGYNEKVRKLSLIHIYLTSGFAFLTDFDHVPKFLLYCTGKCCIIST